MVDGSYVCNQTTILITSKLINIVEKGFKHEMFKACLLLVCKSLNKEILRTLN